LIAEPTMTLQFSEEDLLRELGAATVGKGELLWIDDRSAKYRWRQAEP